MILKKVKITNYRQLQNVELDMQDSLTVLAGPNNSGKTTLISVLKGMFCDKKLSFNYSDIPIQLSSDWLDKILPIFQAVMIKYDRESGVREIITKISNDDKFIADYIMDSFQAQIQVDYNPDNDDIQYFADYLMDLDDTKHSFYFIYTYEPKLQLEMDVSEHDVEEFIQRITRAKYDIDGLLLNEDYSPTIKELYDFQVKGESVLYNGLVYLTFQDEKSTARTLEEAMLNKLLKVDVFHAIKRSEWKEKRKIYNLTFSIPNNKENEEDSEYSIHRIVEATSNGVLFWFELPCKQPVDNSI